MKISTRLLALTGATLVGAQVVSAQAVWQLDENTYGADMQNFFNPIQNSTANFIDINGDGRLDLIYSGNAYNPKYDVRGVWSWNDQCNIYLNNGDGTWEASTFVPVENGTEMVNKKDENGEDILDENGEPIQEEVAKYTLKANHGLPPFSQAQIQPIDFNCDGNVDLFVVGVMSNNEWTGAKEAYEAIKNPNDPDSAFFVALFKNNGDNTFTRVENHGIPVFRSQDDAADGKDMYHNIVSVADYDHDGYPDMVICGRLAEEQPEGYTNDITALFHNEGGTGVFKRMDIAKVQGGVWTNEIREEDEVDADGNVIRQGELIKDKEELPGWFLQFQHNVHFADVNNDGWADIICDGWVSNVWDGFNNSGSNIRIYLNREGKEFEDITPLTPYLKTGYVPRGTSSIMADFDKDGYLDFFAAGYCDNGGFDSRLFLNQLGYDETIFETFEDKSIFFDAEGNKNLDWIERFNCVGRDFDGDGNLDLFFDGVQDSYIHYGQFDGTFLQASQLPSRGYNARDGQTAVGDVTGNGLADQFQVGYAWAQEPVWTNDWHYSGHLFNNVTDVEVEAPEMPTDVKAELADGKITVSWNDVESGDYTCAYNVYVKTPSGKIMSVIPANIENGGVMISMGKETAIRPMVGSYTINAEEDGEYTVGVQALSLYNERYSQFATAKVAGENGVGSIAAGQDAAPVYYNMQGIRVNNPSKGQMLIKVEGNQTTKVAY